jgi:hypothetical protein
MTYTVSAFRIRCPFCGIELDPDSYRLHVAKCPKNPFRRKTGPYGVKV